MCHRLRCVALVALSCATSARPQVCTPHLLGMDRRGPAEAIQWFEAETGYIYHTISAEERGDEVALTVCRVADPIPEHADTTGTIARLDRIEDVQGSLQLADRSPG